jgi:hypothetical protein
MTGKWTPGSPGMAATCAATLQGLSFLCVSLLGASLLGASFALAQSPSPDQISQATAEDLVHQMTMDEKITFVQGGVC